MTTAEAASAGRWARWLLLACTVFGLAVMHTFGHNALTDTHSHAATTAAPGVRSVAVAAALTGAADAAPCDDDHCPGHGTMSGWSVCMAILQGFAVVLLLAVVVLAARRDRPRRPRGAPGGRMSRAPPRRPAGLTLARITVLRI